MEAVSNVGCMSSVLFVWSQGAEFGEYMPNLWMIRLAPKLFPRLRPKPFEM